ncbi:MAG: hypothetical protein JOZ54_15065 [Acidobacteria bacterium]|nr:hypothetical protein [Acidobacteriota bacterium]
MELTRKAGVLTIAAAIALLSIVVLADDLNGDDAFDIVAEPVVIAALFFALASLARLGEIGRELAPSPCVVTLSDPRSPPRA